MFYILSTQDENELIVLSVLTSIEDTLSSLLKGDVNKRSLMENLDLVLLTLDECIDDGIVLAIDSQRIATRVAMRGKTPGDAAPAATGEKTFTQALQSARNQIVQSFR